MFTNKLSIQKMRQFLFSALIICVAFVVSTLAANFNETQSSYNAAQAQTSLWLSLAAYCGKSNYKSHVFKGPTTGFVLTTVISDVSTDTEGFVGYLPSDSSIYVVYRGSESIRNWISNLDAFKTAYTSFPECNCQVHKGFYAAEQAVISGVINEVKRLKLLYPKYNVKTTGHSLGAALAQITSMDLVKAGYSTTVYNFGQPRTGDQAYATFANNEVDTWRIVHNQDIVPHLPLTTGMEYYHVCREEFEDEKHNLKTCDSSCEDKTCSDQFPVSSTNVDDHLLYLNMVVSCDTVS
jgi:hypothetical protein